MSYTFVRDITFKTLADAARGAQIIPQVVKLYKESVNVDVQVLRAISGAPTRVRFVSKIETLDQWQADQAKIQKDPAFMKILGEMGPLVDGSKTQDELWAS